MIREANGSFKSCNSCKRLVPSRLQESHEPKLLFVSLTKFIRSKLSSFSAHVSGGHRLQQVQFVSRARSGLVPASHGRLATAGITRLFHLVAGDCPHHGILFHFSLLFRLGI